MNSYVDNSGRRIPFERELGRGGEGAVFALSGDSLSVAKVYHNPSPQLDQKLSAMLSRANSELTAVTAWPSRLIYDAATRRFAGFLMPRIDNCQHIQRLYNPRQRVQAFPQAGWNFQVRAARNLAAAFDEVHKAGCLVGDVNERNIQVSVRQALVRLVDCDSFQVQVNGKSFLCEVGSDGYVPPELLGCSFKGLVRTVNHDCFGLAVLIYQLLFVGRHPYQGLYQGRDDPTRDQLIKEFRFAQGPAAKSWAMAPGPHMPTFADIPSGVGSLFRRAFERGSEKNMRPRASEWLDGLGELEKSLVKCAEDEGHSYWRGAGGCTWCRLERNGGPEYYFGIGETSRGFSLDERKLQEVLRRLDQVEKITTYNRSHYQSPISMAETPLPPRIAQIGQEVTRLAENLRQSEQECAMCDRNDEEHALVQLKQFEAELVRQLGPKVQELDRELQAALLAVADERRRREYLEPLLIGPALLGFLIMLGTVYHWAFGVVGGMMAIGFGTSFAVYFYRVRQTPEEQRVANAARTKEQTQTQYSAERQGAIDRLNMELKHRKESRQASLNSLRVSLQNATVRFQHEFDSEIGRLRQAILSTDQKLQSLESRWQNIVDSHVCEKNACSAKIHELVSRCKSIGTQYEAESKRVAANAEATARARHLRLFSIDEAGIEGIGFGRIQILASAGIYTAEDVEEYRVKRIKGFKNVLTGRLLAWKAGVLRQFRFSAATSGASAELRNLVANCKNQEKQVHAEMNRHLSTLESLAAKCQASTASLVPELRLALSEYERAKLAEANFRKAFSNRYAA